jgi:hypothetical protein
MTDRDSLNVEEYKKAVSKMSFGLVRPKIEKVGVNEKRPH